MRLAKEIGQDLYDDYVNDSSYAPHATVTPDLAEVAEAIWVARDQLAVTKAVGLNDPALWPETDRVQEHFCVYRVLARLAREGLFDETVGFNYDCGKEAGLAAEGFFRSPRTAHGREWRDHATVIADAGQYMGLDAPGAFRYSKAHAGARSASARWVRPTKRKRRSRSSSGKAS